MRGCHILFRFVSLACDHRKHSRHPQPLMIEAIKRGHLALARQVRMVYLNMAGDILQQPICIDKSAKPIHQPLYRRIEFAYQIGIIRESVIVQNRIDPQQRQIRSRHLDPGRIQRQHRPVFVLRRRKLSQSLREKRRIVESIIRGPGEDSRLGPPLSLFTPGTVNKRVLHTQLSRVCARRPYIVEQPIAALEIADALGSIGSLIDSHIFQRNRFGAAAELYLQITKRPWLETLPRQRAFFNQYPVGAFSILQGRCNVPVNDIFTVAKIDNTTGRSCNPDLDVAEYLPAKIQQYCDAFIPTRSLYVRNPGFSEQSLFIFDLP